MPDAVTGCPFQAETPARCPRRAARDLKVAKCTSTQCDSWLVNTADGARDFELRPTVLIGAHGLPIFAYGDSHRRRAHRPPGERVRHRRLGPPLSPRRSAGQARPRWV
jgi:hypothetical protein